MANMPQNKQISKETRKFVYGLMQEADLDILPPGLSQKIYGDLLLRLDAKLTIAALAALPDVKVNHFKKLLSENKTPSQVSDFLNKNVPNIGEVYETAFWDFRKVYLGR